MRLFLRLYWLWWCVCCNPYYCQVQSLVRLIHNSFNPRKRYHRHHATTNPHFIGFDLGTSGARISVIERQQQVQRQRDATTITTTTTYDIDGNEQSEFVVVYQEVFAKSVPWTTTQTKDSSTTTTTTRSDTSNNCGSSCSDSSYDDPNAWMDAVDQLLRATQQSLDTNILSSIKSICISGTSASCCLVGMDDDDDDGGGSGDYNNILQVTRPPRMYNYHVINSCCSSSNNNNGDYHSSFGQRALDIIDRWAPEKHTARSATGSLAKLLAWHLEHPLANEMFCHQSDYVRLRLSSSSSSTTSCWSDWHNCLKLGYDVCLLCWPTWLLNCLKAVGVTNPLGGILPTNVVSPGQPIAHIHPHVAAMYGLSPETWLVAGTTDSNAAFMAAACGEMGLVTDSSQQQQQQQQQLVGTAVSSLGSTLALKLLSQTYVEDADRGVYSHRFPHISESTSLSDNNQLSDNKDNNDNDEKLSSPLWLVGGASNVGCAVLRQESFDNDELDRLSAEIDPTIDSTLSYYPLTTNARGERFPVANAEKLPCLTPKPDNRREYLHGILQGISNVERDGYRVLGELGASPSHPTIIWTCGGGSRNTMWTTMRERRINEQIVGDPCGAGAATANAAPVKVKRAIHVEASYGAALLAASSFH